MKSTECKRVYKKTPQDTFKIISVKKRKNVTKKLLYCQWREYLKGAEVMTFIVAGGVGQVSELFHLTCRRARTSDQVKHDIGPPQY